jgi:ubiquinone/menaquinone biosynthesis C-methylase UbiE
LTEQGYEKFMGRWSRAAGTVFLDWLALPSGLRWLDVGCGTGAFTETIQKRCSPSELVAVDPAETQVAYAQSCYGSLGIDFRVVDARSLPFESQNFDAAVSALVINFIPDREKAVAEMKRVTRTGGIVAAYVWDFAGERGPVEHLNAALAKVTGRSTSAAIYPESTTVESLEGLFKSVGLAEVASRPIDIQLIFSDFDDYWTSNATRLGSVAVKVINSLNEAKKQEVQQLLRATLPLDNQGLVSYSARVNAVRGIA